MWIDARRSAYSDHDDQRGNRADGNPPPLLAGQPCSLQLIEVLRQLMQILLIQLGQALIDLLLRESARSEDLGYLLIGDDIADQREIRIARRRSRPRP